MNRAKPTGALEAARIFLADTAVVIPVFAARHIDAAALSGVLNDTVAGCLAQGIPPGRLCLSVDGRQGRPLAETIARTHGVPVVTAKENRGKLAAVRLGVERLHADSGWRSLGVLDQDGDHFPNDLANLARMARHIRETDGTERFLVLGERISRHRPMGFLRGELEELADRVLLDALQYDAAVTGRPLRLEYALALGEFPDFHSGFKLFDRRTALDVFMSEPRLCGASDDAYYRHAVEAVMTVEALDAGAILAVVDRRTLNEQPFSTFGVLNRCRLVADKMIWPLRRLNVPTPFAAQWLANHLGRIPLHTLVPEGRDELRCIAKTVIADRGGDAKTVDSFAQTPFV